MYKIFPPLTPLLSFHMTLQYLANLGNNHLYLYAVRTTLAFKTVFLHIHLNLSHKIIFKMSMHFIIPVHISFCICIIPAFWVSFNAIVFWSIIIADLHDHTWPYMTMQYVYYDFRFGRTLELAMCYGRVLKRVNFGQIYWNVCQCKLCVFNLYSGKKDIREIQT